MCVWNIFFFAITPVFLFAKNDFSLRRCAVQHNQEFKSCDKSATTEKLILQPRAKRQQWEKWENQAGLAEEAEEEEAEVQIQHLGMFVCWLTVYV